jgi:hypothetical protein
MMQQHRSILARALRLCALAALPGASAMISSCSEITASSALDVRFEITGTRAGTVTENSDGSAIADAANAATGSGAVVILGRMVTPASCYVLSPVVNASASVLDVLIEARANGACLPGVMSTSYSLRIGGLRAGAYHLRVSHRIVGAFVASVPVLEKEIRVE